MQLNIDMIVYICTTIIAMSTAGGIVIKGFKKSIEKTTEEIIHSEIATCIQNIETEIKSLRDYVHEFVSEQKITNKQTRKSLLASTRDRINEAHDYYMKKNFIGAHSLFVVEELYTAYKELGGNSFIDRQMEDIRSLEVISAETTKLDK